MQNQKSNSNGRGLCKRTQKSKRKKPRSIQERNRGTPTRSDCEQRSRTNYDRGTSREHRRDRSRIRNDRSTPTRVQTNDNSGKAENIKERERLRRRRHLMKRLAELPIQKLKHSDHQYDGMSHKTLPIHSLSENCSAAEQHRR